MTPNSQHRLVVGDKIDPVWLRYLQSLDGKANASDIRAIATALGSPDGTVANIPEQSADDVRILQGAGIAVTRDDAGAYAIALRPLGDSGAGTFKLITRDSTGRLSGTADGSAADVPYDNTASGLAATDAQAAIDELADEKLDDAPSDGATYGRKDGGWVAAGGGGSSGVYWNPADKDSKLSLANDDSCVLRSTTSSGTWCALRSMTSHATGKWYAECINVFSGSSAGSMIFGVADSMFALTNYVGSDTHSWGIQANNTTVLVYSNGTSTSTGTPVIGHGGRAMVAYDAATGNLWLGTAGVWHNTGNPALGINPTYTIAPGTVLYLALAEQNSPQQCTLRNNPGESLYSPPFGFGMWG